jgi:coproporphyrinogen III oxidase
MGVNRVQIEDFFKGLQDHICNALERIDGQRVFVEDLWQRADGGGGRSRVIQGGAVFEKGGVNFSAVHGTLPENIRTALKVKGTQFYATGISIVIHPQNPFVPIIHMNTRYFEIADETYWFGGGLMLHRIMW